MNAATASGPSTMSSRPMRGWPILCWLMRGGWLVWLASWCGLATAAGTQPMSLADLSLQVGVSNAVISPDGRTVAVVISREDYGNNRHVRSLVLVDVASGTQREPAPGQTSISAPKWSPTGDRLAWLDASEAGTVQIHVKANDGSASLATRITNLNGGVQSYGWGADGKSFVFMANELPPPAATGPEEHLTAFEVSDNDYLAARAPVRTYLGRVVIQTGEVSRLSADRQHVKSFVVLPDDRSILFLSEPGTRRSGNLRAALNMATVGGAPRTVVDGPELSPAPLQTLFPGSPDGRFIAYSRSRGPEPFFRPNGLMVRPARGGEERWLSAAIDRNFGQMVWLPDSASVIAVAPDRTSDAVWRLGLDGTIRRLELGGIRQISSLSISNTGTLAFIGAREQHPAEVYVASSSTSPPRQLTKFNAVLAQRALGKVTTVTWRSDGFELSGVLTYPPGYRPGHKYPLVLDIHGGPMSTSNAAFHAFDQLLAAQGWLVFAPNYRGSNSAGDEFQRAIINDAGDGPGRDVMTGIEAIKALGIVDETRIAISGWSYGGYLTAWLTAQHSNWRAAVAAAAVTDWYDSYSLSDANEFFGFGLGGSPWLRNNAANYWRQSPMAYAQQIRTPMLILSTTGDVRVPVTQSYKLFRALRDNAVPVRFVAYAQGGHMPSDPVNQRDWYRRWLEWIDECFRAGQPQVRQ